MERVDAKVCCHSSCRDGLQEKSLFVMKEPLHTELSRFLILQQKNPTLAALEMKRGARLVGLARDGKVKDLETMLRIRPTSWWFTSYMFSEAVLNNRFKVVDLMVSEGLMLDQPPVRDILTQLAERASRDGSDAVRMTTHLVSSVGLLASHQRCKDWYTALHIACERGLYALAVCLISLGADVNAVAKDDIMPLHCAEKAPDPEPLRVLLVEHGARRTWRRDAPHSVLPVSGNEACRLLDVEDVDPGDDPNAYILDTQN